MKTIIQPCCEKIISLFYKDKGAKIHLRGIARNTELNENSVTRFLKQLEERQILHSEREGNLKKYSIKTNDFTYTIFTYFDIKRFHSLPSMRKNAILYFLKELKEKPVITLLFGSTAKNNFNKHSDIDLLLIVNKKIPTKEAEDYAESQTGIRISCFQLEFKDFLLELKIKEDKVVQSALHTGYPLTNHIEFYRNYFS